MTDISDALTVTFTGADSAKVRAAARARGVSPQEFVVGEFRRSAEFDALRASVADPQGAVAPEATAWAGTMRSGTTTLWGRAGQKE